MIFNLKSVLDVMAAFASKFELVQFGDTQSQRKEA